MLRNMRVRTKLAVILAAPVLALLLLGGWGVSERLTAADRASDGSRFIELGAAAGTLTHELQKEMLLSVGSLSQVVALTDEELDEQRQATDRAMARFQSRLAATESLLPPDASGWSTLRSTGDELAQYREQVDTGVGDPGNFAVFYGRIAGAVQDLSTELTTAAASVTPEVAGRLTSLTALTNAKSLFARQAAVLVRVFTTHAIDDGGRNELVSEAAAYDTELSVFYATATRDAQDQLRNLLRSPGAVGAQRTLDDVLDAEAGALTGGAAIWAESANVQIDALRQVEHRLAEELVESAASVADATARDVRLYGFGALGAVLLAIGLALVTARSLTRPLRRLTDAAYRLSRERLPALVDALHRTGGEDMDAELVPITVDSHDEIGQLADAFNTVQSVTGQVAEEQRALLTKGIGDTFVTLARRNQSLIDRQITFLDELEATEQDPDTLEHLFQLDHLATRMRRNAESLLVLAGVEPARRRGQPVQLADAVRAAVSEVQDFNRIDLLVLDEAAVEGGVAVDLAHLLAELMENATAFSPPETRVEIVGHLTRDGYILSVTDQGIGMSDAQLEEANAVLVRPPLVGLSLARSLGFIVVSRLAQRSGVGVRVTHSVAGGVTAVVNVPPALLVDLSPAAEAALGPAPAAWSPPDERTATTAAPAPTAAPAAPTAPAPTGADRAPATAATAPTAAAAPPVAPAPHDAAPARPVAPAPLPPAGPLPQRATGTPPSWAPPGHHRPTQPPAPAPAPAPAAAADDTAAPDDRWVAPPAHVDPGPWLVRPPGEPEPGRWSPQAAPAPAPAGGTPAWDSPGREPSAPMERPPAPAPEPSAPPREWVPVATPPASLSDALPEGPAFDRGLAALVTDGEAGAQRSPADGTGPPALPTRQPGASRDGLPSGPLPTRDPSGRPTPPPAPGPATRATARSPEEVRAMLSNYRSGLSRGRAPRTDQPAGEDRARGDEGERRS